MGDSEFNHGSELGRSWVKRCMIVTSVPILALAKALLNQANYIVFQTHWTKGSVIRFSNCTTVPEA